MKESEVSLTRASRAFSTLHEVLKDIGWNPRQDGDSAAFVVSFDPPYIPVAYAYAAISEELELFYFHITLGVAAAAGRREETARFLTMANWSLMSGNFDMDYEDGEIRFRSSVCFGGVELSDALIRNAILFAMNAVERFANGAIEVMARGKSAREAFEEAAHADGMTGA